MAQIARSGDLMQRLAAYILERAEDLRSSEERKAEGDHLRAVGLAWLKSKGSTSSDGSGSYVATDGSDANCRVSTVVDGARSWTLFELSEVTQDGRKYVTTVSITVGNKNVFAFVTMEVGSVTRLVAPVEADAKCPRVVRDLLAQSGNWLHGASLLRPLIPVAGFEAGMSLGQEIQDGYRTIPIVVVSRPKGRAALPRLDELIASDLAGLANVYSADEEASWALTDTLRKPLSTYGGAIRIYWPRFSLNDDPFRHQLWTATRLQGIELDSQLALDRIRRQVRTIIMKASAASVVRPGEIDQIRTAATRSEFAALQARASELEQLKARASSLEEFKEIADSYATDNDKLRQDLATRDDELERLQNELHGLEFSNQALIFALENAKVATVQADEVPPDAPDQDEADQPPAPGEIRYYKKTHSTSAHDVLVQVGDCGHNSWQNAAKADKAKKGLERLLRSQPEWKKLQHCGPCQGGGLWRVEW
jgi:hypothetical protein